MNKIAISLICATRNRHNELRRLLISLEQQTSNEFELIIVDQNESNLIVDIVEQFKTKISIIHLRYSFSSNTKARNKGVKHASYSWVGFPDDDCWYPPDTIEKIGRHPIGRESGIFINWMDPLPEIPKKMFAFEEGIMKLEEAFTLASCICIFFDKDIFVNLGGFNEKMGLGNDTLVQAGEEQDLLLKIISHEGIIYKQPEILVYHPMNERVWDNTFRTRIISQGACDVYFVRKYKGIFPAAQLQMHWLGGFFFNLLRGRWKNLQWYFYKLWGSIKLSHKL